MQEKKQTDRRELICINVDKVYDWIVKEMSFDFPVPEEKIEFFPKELVPCEEIKHATVTCEVTPDKKHPITILGREDRQFSIEGNTVSLQQLHIRKNFKLKIFLTLRDGTKLRSESIDLSRSELVTLCAPNGTNVEVLYTNLECFVCTTGKITGYENGKIKFKGLTISVATCQSIQSTYPVTVEFLANYCDPRADLPIACPGPMRPQQCSVVFPDAGNC